MNKKSIQTARTKIWLRSAGIYLIVSLFAPLPHLISADVLTSGTIDKLQSLTARLDNFNGNISWTHYSEGLSGGVILRIESMPGNQAYSILHEGKDIQELPLATIQWHEITSTSLAQNAKTAWYHSAQSPKLDRIAVQELNDKLSRLKSADFASHAPPKFNFVSYKADVVTTAGLSTQASMPDGSTSEFHSPDATLVALLSKQPSPVRWHIDPEVWMRILASTNWTPGSSGRRTTNFEISDTAYTIELGPDHFPYMTKEEKVMPGGWTRVIVSKFEEWVQVDNIWVPKSINTDVLFQDGIRSAPISRQLFVLNPA